MRTLRGGFTTGACAAAAAKAAALVLCGHEPPSVMTIEMSDGESVEFPVRYARRVGERCEAAVRKDAGDDPDVTHGVDVVARLGWSGEPGLRFRAGEGVGVVTRPGLQVSPGEPAINPGPRRMIEAAVRSVTRKGLEVTISIPRGRELAAKTFNARLGIEGGLSILGTTGRVRPFSCPALRQALKCALDVATAAGVTELVLAPGNIGEKAARRHFRLRQEQVVLVSNEWGFMLDQASRGPFRRCLCVGHPGKLAKLADAQWDTHSSRSTSAVPRVASLVEAVLGRPAAESSTVEGLFAGLDTSERRRVGDMLAREVRRAVLERVSSRLEIAVVLVNMQGDILGQAGDVQAWRMNRE